MFNSKRVYNQKKNKIWNINNDISWHAVFDIARLDIR